MKKIILGFCLGLVLALPFLAYTFNKEERILTVSVEIVKEMIPENAADWPLYIYAAKVNTRLPLSTFKGKLSDLPITVKLDETMYLLPEKTLKDADEVVIVAKVSKNKNPHQKSEQDLVGFSETIYFNQGAQQKIKVLIDQHDKIKQGS